MYVQSLRLIGTILSPLRARICLYEIKFRALVYVALVECNFWEPRLPYALNWIEQRVHLLITQAIT